MKKELSAIFGENFHLEPILNIPGLPFYMVHDRSFFEITIAEVSFLLVSISEQDKFSALALEKQLEKYMRMTDMNAAFAFPSLNRPQRNALTNKMIPFIVMPDQVFLPFLGIFLKDQFKKRKLTSLVQFTPAAQSLFLYFLYQAKDSTVLKKDAAAALGLTKTSITRASEELSAAQLIEEESFGREIRMRAIGTGADFYEKGKSYLINPVTKVIATNLSEQLNHYPSAGETALAKRSMLNEPKIPVIAVWRKDSILQSLVDVDEKWSDKALMHLEVWKYDPALFAQDDLVDPVSMALSLKDVYDERVQGELAEVMEELQW